MATVVFVDDHPDTAASYARIAEMQGPATATATPETARIEGPTRERDEVIVGRRSALRLLRR